MYYDYDNWWCADEDGMVGVDQYGYFEYSWEEFTGIYYYESEDASVFA